MKRFFISKVLRISTDVLADAIQFIYIPNDPVEVATLPNRRWLIPIYLVYLSGREGLESPY
jgi:hypothetical protein